MSRVFSSVHGDLEGPFSSPPLFIYLISAVAVLGEDTRLQKGPFPSHPIFISLTCPYSLVTPSAAAKSETVLLGRAQAEMLLSCRVGEQDYSGLFFFY